MQMEALADTNHDLLLKDSHKKLAEIMKKCLRQLPNTVQLDQC